MLKRVFGYVRLKRQILILLIAVITTFAGAAMPILYGTIIDKILVIKDYDMFWKFILLYFGFIVVEIITGYAQNCIIVKTGEEVALKLRKQVYDKISLLDYNSKNKYGAGNIVSLYNSDIFQVTNLLSRFVYDIVLQVVTIIIILVVMFWMSIKLAISVLVLIPVFFLIFMKMAAKTQAVVKIRQETYVDLNSQIQEDIKGSSFLQITACMKYRHNKMNELFTKFFKVNYRFSKLNGLVNQIGTFLASLADFIVLGVGGYLCMNGNLSIGTIIAFEAYAAHLFSPILSLVSLNQIAHVAKPSLNRIFGFIDLDSSCEDSTAAADLKEEIASLELENVSFSYGEKEVLSDVSFRVKPKSFHFIIGESGCGKTTICALLCKLLRTKEGKIKINGENISKFTNASIRNKIYYLHQELIIYKGTIRENIELGQKYSDSDIIHILEVVCLTKIGNKPIDLEMPIDSNGDSLSGGEKQRLVLARALIRNFEVLILDEPTAGLDLVCRRKLISNLKVQAEERTIIMISHNTEEFEFGDHLTVIEEGRVALDGSYSQLTEHPYFRNMLSKMNDISINNALELS